MINEDRKLLVVVSDEEVYEALHYQIDRVAGLSPVYTGTVTIPYKKCVEFESGILVLGNRTFPFYLGSEDPFTFLDMDKAAFSFVSFSQVNLGPEKCGTYPGKEHTSSAHALWYAQIIFNPSIRPIYQDWLLEQNDPRQVRSSQEDPTSP